MVLRPRPFGEAIRYVLGLPPDTPDADVLMHAVFARMALDEAEGRAPTSNPAPSNDPADTLARLRCAQKQDHAPHSWGVYSEQQQTVVDVWCDGVPRE